MNKFKLIMFLLGVILLNACVIPRKTVFVKDIRPDTLYQVAKMPPLLLQKNDRISIEVSAKNPELAVPFNAGPGSYQVSEKGALSATAQNAANPRGYLIDQDGNISFPILGTIPVENLTLREVQALVFNRLQKENYIKDPIVKVELLNFKINMMGEVQNIGVFDVPDARITLLEAINRAGGLTTNATTDKVTIIREENGTRRIIETDIESIKLFDSPAYYLKQNDIVYVLPKAAEQTLREQRGWQYFGTILGSVTLIFSILNLVK